MDSFDCNDSLCDEIEKVLADDDEGLSKAAHEIHFTLINIDLREYLVLNTVNMNHSEFTKFRKRIMDYLNEYQQNIMTRRVLLVKIKHNGKELQVQLEDSDS